MVDLKTMALSQVGIGKDNPETLSFKTYRNYAVTIANIITKEYGSDSLQNLRFTLQNNISGKLQRKPNIDIEHIKQLLMNSWHTELNFLLPTKIDEEFTRYSLHWAPVQAYYAIYLSLRGLFESCKDISNNTHRSTLVKVSDWITKRSLFPYPWSCFCTGMSDLKNVKFHCFKGDIPKVSPLSIPTLSDLEGHYAMFLKTTRDRQFDKKKENAKHIKTKSGKPKKSFSVQDKTRLDQELTPTTLFDGMYRLRIKSNYEEAETYYLHDLATADTIEFYNALNKIIFTTLFISEYMIIEYLSFIEFERFYNEFDNKITSLALKSEGIFKRMPFYR